VTDRLVVVGGLDLEARRLFVASASSAIERAEGLVELDCSCVDALDEGTLGMLVMVARFAQRRGQRVVLDLPSERVRHDLDDAGVGYLFAWSA
jgi:ABC-type transporter Mla MlaB component